MTLSSSSSGFEEGPRPGARLRAGRLLILGKICLAGALAIPLSGCLSTQTPDLRQDVDALRAEVSRLQESNERLEAELKTLQEGRAGGGNASSTDVAALDARIVSLESQISALRQRLDDSQERMNTFAVDLQSTRELALRSQPPRTAPSQPPEGDLEAPAPPAPEGSATGLEDSPGAGAVEDTYSAAYADFTKGNYELAIAGFREFIKNYSGSELADNAQFWIAESYYSQGDFEAAAGAYDEVVQKYPKGDRVPAAYLKKALCLMEMNRAAEAAVLLQHLVQTYPTSEEAALARDRLQGMGVKP